MSRIKSTAAEALVDLSVDTVDFDLEKEEVASDLVQELGIEQQVQDDLQKILMPLNFTLVRLVFPHCLAQKKKFTFPVKP